MVPRGVHSQDKDISGFGSHEYQKHRSAWYEEDIEGFGFQKVIVDLSKHIQGDDKDFGCIYSTWEK